jgi:hypothetical protein
MHPISVETQDLLDRIIEIQRRIDDLGLSVHNDRVQKGLYERQSRL